MPSEPSRSFVIHKADGGVYGKVQYVMHYDATHHSFQMNLGACQTPPE